MVDMDDDLPHKTHIADSTGWTAEMVESADTIPHDIWDICAGNQNPLLSHAFFSALENSQSACADTGWIPRHLVLRDHSEQICGILPLYLKTHSYGEYVFDHSWADAWRRAGGQYYPKAQSGIPFSPVPGQRLLIDPSLPAEQARDAAAVLARACLGCVDQLGLSSAHITFLSKDEHDALTLTSPDAAPDTPSGEWISRIGMQFHWHNKSYQDFDDFLSRLASRKRKSIRRERRDIANAGVQLVQKQGDDLTTGDWDQFYRFYLATIDRKWGGAYLTRDFFDQIHNSMRDHILLVIASHDGDPVAGAINFIGQDTLYGRNWGSLVDIPFLHFETCYYQAIDFAITNGLARVEAGAQGLHKVPAWL
jgi:predicted N-acyltransferase